MGNKYTQKLIKKKSFEIFHQRSQKRQTRKSEQSRSLSERRFAGDDSDQEENFNKIRKMYSSSINKYSSQSRDDIRRKNYDLSYLSNPYLLETPS